MSQFTTPAVLELLDNYRWRLVEPFEYYTFLPFGKPDDYGLYDRIEGLKSHGYVGYCPIYHITVPIDYVTDLTSVPRVLWSIFPPNGKYAKAAIVHDYLYTNAIGTRAWADEVFCEAMGVLGVPRWRKYVMYWSVRLFGRGNYE